MAFISAIGADATRWIAVAPPTASAQPDIRLAEIERELDRTSDAFTDAVNLLERSLPLSFGA